MHDACTQVRSHPGTLGAEEEAKKDHPRFKRPWEAREELLQELGEQLAGK